MQRPELKENIPVKKGQVPSVVCRSLFTSGVASSVWPEEMADRKALQEVSQSVELVYFGANNFEIPAWCSHAENKFH